jgi:hypothetical protein
MLNKQLNQPLVAVSGSCEQVAVEEVIVRFDHLLGVDGMTAQQKRSGYRECINML